MALTTFDPEEAARGLTRAVHELRLHGMILYGRPRERPLGDPNCWPIFETAVASCAPLYIHPQPLLSAVRAAYCQGLGESLDNVLATAGLGWRYETGVEALRLVLADFFDQFPELQVILDHRGETVPFFLERIDTLLSAAGLQWPVSDYFRTNVFVTPSGIFSPRYLRWACELMRPEHILFSIDYPYRFALKGAARRFLETADFSPARRRSVAHGTWDRRRAAVPR